MKQELNQYYHGVNKWGEKTIALSIDGSMIPFFLFFIVMMRGIKGEMYISFALMFMWMLIAFISNTGVFMKALNDKNMIFVYIYLFYAFIISVAFEGIVTSIGNIIGQLTIFIGILMFNYYKRKCSPKSFKRIIAFIVIIWGYYCVKALIFYSENPYAAREIISGSGSGYGNVAIGGGYGLAYGSAILGVYLFSLVTFHRVKQKGIQMLLIGLTILLFFITLQTGSTITLFAMIFGLCGSLLLSISAKKDESSKKMLIRKVFQNLFIGGILLTILVNLKNIGAFLVRLSASFTDVLLASRIEQFGMKLLTGSSKGTLAAREKLYNESISTFMDNPLVGTSLDFGLRMNSLIGGHSELLDNFAKLGLIGMIPFLLIYCFSVGSERKRSKEVVSGAYILTFAVLFIFNPFNYPQANFVLFFLIPSIGWYLHSKKIEIGNNVTVNRKETILDR